MVVGSLWISISWLCRYYGGRRGWDPGWKALFSGWNSVLTHLQADILSNVHRAYCIEIVYHALKPTFITLYTWISKFYPRFLPSYNLLSWVLASTFSCLNSFLPAHILHVL